MLTRDDAIRIARDAGIQQVIQHAGGVLVIPDAVLERFAAAAYAAGAADEREACAQVCETVAAHWQQVRESGPEAGADECAIAIRQRAAYRQLTPDELAAAGRNAGLPMPADPPKMAPIREWLRVCRCGPDGCADSACPGRTA